MRKAHHTRRGRTVPVVMAAGLLLVACGGDDSADGGTASTSAAPGSAVTTAEMAAVATTYADLVYASYDASVTSANLLVEAIDTFVDQPAEATLRAAREQWLAARDDYAPTEAFRFYDGPIDDPEDGPEGRINAWPMDEAYVDYVEGDPDAGIINDTAGYPEITPDVLVSANEQGGETNISTGWHAIEFLLWGQDLDDDGPGARPVSDYTTAPNAERRATYLTLLAELLVDDLTAVRDEWDPADDDGYRATFLADPETAVGHIFRGIGALTAGELAGERMAVAYETRDEEDEHSCFSDNTNADVYGDVLGIQRVYLADFEGIDGPSLSSLVARVAPDLDVSLRARMDETVTLAATFPMSFDRMLVGSDDSEGRTALLRAITSLEEQGQQIAEAADALGISVNLEV